MHRPVQAQYSYNSMRVMIRAQVIKYSSKLLKKCFYLRLATFEQGMSIATGQDRSRGQDRNQHFLLVGFKRFELPSNIFWKSIV
jgi:hypothetical protein